MMNVSVCNIFIVFYDSINWFSVQSKIKIDPYKGLDVDDIHYKVCLL